MICPHCNAEIRDDSNFCIYCGEVPGGVSPPAYAPYLQYAGQYGLDIAKVLGDTLKLYIRHFGILCLVGLIVVGIPAIISICLISVQQAQENAALDVLTALALNLGLVLLNFLAQCYVAIIAVRQCLHTARGGTGLREGLMFPPVSMFLNMIGLMLIITCIIMVLMLPAFFVFFLVIGFGAMAGGGPAPVFLMVGLAVLFVMGLPVIWLAIRIWLANVFLVDQNTDCINALMQAWRVSSGNFWALFGVIFLLLCPALCWTVACYVAAYAMTGNVEMMQTIPGIIIHSGSLVPIALLVHFGTGLAYLQLTGQPYQVEGEEKFGFE